MVNADTLASTVKNSGLDFSILTYDVPEGMPYMYPIIARALRKRALFFNLSCYLIQSAQRNILEMAIEQAMTTAELECKKSGKLFRRVDYKIYRFDPAQSEQLRQDSAIALNKQVADIGKSLLENIDRYDEKLKSNKYDLDTHLTRFSGAIRKAQHDLDEARGLAMLFLIEKDVAVAIDAAAKVLTAKTVVLDKAKEDAKKLEEAAAKAEAGE